MKIKIQPILIVCILVTFSLYFSACEGNLGDVDRQSGVYTKTVTPTETITPVWFPATSTPTPIPQPTAVPTNERRPGIATILLNDSFNKQNNWQTYMNNSGSVAYGKKDLTLSVSQPKGHLTSFRSDIVLNDYYLEITLNANLCRGEDTYGLLFRTNSEADFYRLMFSCNGQIRLERLNNYKVAILNNWEQSGQIPIGSPYQFRLGLWVRNNEFRVFVNDIYQFSATDPVWTFGGLGVFARSANDNALSVSFSDLVVYDLSQDAYQEIQSGEITETESGET